MMGKAIQDLIIAIDGHSSGGKSTFAKAIAKKLGMLSESFIELAIQDQLRQEKLHYTVSLAKSPKKKIAV